MERINGDASCDAQFDMLIFWNGRVVFLDQVYDLLGNYFSNGLISLAYDQGEFIAAKRIVQGHKAKSPAWVFSPAAWRAHLERGRKLDRLEQAQARALEEVKRSLIPARLSS